VLNQGGGESGVEQGHAGGEACLSTSGSRVFPLCFVSNRGLLDKKYHFVFLPLHSRLGLLARTFECKVRQEWLEGMFLTEICNLSVQ